MSTKGEQNKGVANHFAKEVLDDELFIDALYQELDKERSNAVTSVPSQSLDDRIIAAAHHALNKKVQVTKSKVKPAEVKRAKVDKQRDKQLKSQKLSAWRVPFSLAASTVLVMILFVNQGDEAIVPQSRIIPQTGIVPQGNMSPQHNEFAEPVLTDTKMNLDTRLKSTSVQSNLHKSDSEASPSTIVTALPIKQAPKRPAVKRIARSAYQAQEIKPDSLSPELSMMQNSALSHNALDKKKRKPTKETARPANVKPPVWLSHTRYLLLRKQHAQWALLEENKEGYLIKVLVDNSKHENYFLSKERYKIKVLSNQKNRPASFEVINVIQK